MNECMYVCMYDACMYVQPLFNVRAHSRNFFFNVRAQTHNIYVWMDVCIHMCATFRALLT